MHTPAAIKWTKQCLRDAFRGAARRASGFSFVEILTMCPTDWFVEPTETPDWVEQQLRADVSAARPEAAGGLTAGGGGMRAMVRGVALAAMVVLGMARLASAAFHFTVIDEVMSGVGADPTVQYVEVRMLSGGQGVVGNTRLTVFSCDGTTQTVLLLVPGPTLSVTTSGTRWIMATPSFAAASCITPDFTFTPPVGHPGIFPTCGMVCWGAPGAVPPSPGSWDPTVPDNYVDCVAYGSYTGPTPTGFTSANSADPANGSMSLTRTGTTANNSTQFALMAPSPRNDSGLTGTFGGACPTTTTTPGASTTSTTTSGGGGGGPTTTLAPPFSGGAPKKTDCFSEWIVAGAAGGKPAFKCKDNDPACDTSPDRAASSAPRSASTTRRTRSTRASARPDRSRSS